MIRKSLGPPLLSLFFLLLFLCASPVAGQDRSFRIDHTVSVQNPGAQLFHVVSEVKNIKQPRLELSLPTWSPGYYIIQNYAKNLVRFKITDAGGTPLAHRMTRPQTWVVNTSGRDRIKVEFDYYATTLALHQAKISNDFAFFTGTELFLMAAGHRQSPSRVRYVIPQGWKIISALKATSDPMVFTAPDYDTLVDAPTEMGSFDLTTFEVEHKPHYFAAYPAGAFSPDQTKQFTAMLARIATTQSALFGGLPYEKYVYFYFFVPPDSGAVGMEHLNSHAVFAVTPATPSMQKLILVSSHEFFHLWNVKRIRPTGMWPYDYGRENPTPLLWVCEGFTNYYGNLNAHRAGLMSGEDFLASQADVMNGLDTNPASAYISPADSSVMTWLTDQPVAFSVSYYQQGQNLGALLDLSIRHDTAGKSSLDTIMVALYRDFYLQGRGYTTEDLLRLINRTTRRDYHDFFNRYVWGVEVPPYNTIYNYAGYNAEKTATQVPSIGLSGTMVSSGILVSAIVPDSPAAQAGLAVNDIITEIDGQPATTALLMTAQIGQTLMLTVNRAGDIKQMSLTIGSREVSAYQITEVQSPTKEQLKIREGWLKVRG